METITVDFQKRIDQSMTYESYRDLIDRLLEEKKTTGPKQSESLWNYSKLNAKRMERLDKTVKLLPEVAADLQNIERGQYWIVLSEGWCGDAAQILPVLHKMATSAPNVSLHLLLRDENLELMDKYLTNNGRSIPKLIVLEKDDMNELGSWGPRPEELQKQFMDFKENPGDITYAEFSKSIQMWYNRDKTVSIQKEVMEIVKGS